jgi:outer membrane protein insertion porin family
MPVLQPQIPHSRTVRCLLAAAALCASAVNPDTVIAQEQPQPAPAPAQAPKSPQPEVEPFEGRVVRVVTFKTPDRLSGPDQSGPPVPGGPLDASTETFARNQLRLREGSPFSAELVSRDIASLNRTGRFKRVESRVQMLSDGTVELVYVIEPQPLITAVQTVGNRVFSDQEIASGTDILVGTPVDPTLLNRAARHIEDRYKEKGYHNALVTIDQHELDATGIVLFRIREGEKTRVTDVRFEGNLSISAEELRTAIKTHEAWLFDKGALDNDILDQDVAAVTGYYKDRGYLDVKVDRRVVTSPNLREAVVAFVVYEGPVYTVRDLKVQVDPDEEPRFATEQLLGLMDIHAGDVYSEEKLKTSQNAVKEAYSKLGYTDMEVQHHERKVPDMPLVDIVMVVHQGRHYKTGMIVIEGNTLTRDDVVRRQITLKPERPLDITEAKLTESRLRQTNLFDPKGVKVTLQPEDPENPGYRDVLVQVQETNTGKFAVGAGINSDAGVVGQVSVTQNNFDITDVPDTWGELFRGEAFRGGGQTFSIQALPGTQVNTYSISLSEPALFESHYSGSAAAVYHTRDYNSYTEQRYGGDFSLGERFGSRWNATVPIRLENVTLTHVNSDAPTDYFKVEDPHLVASVGLRFSRSSADKVAFPTKGTRIQFGVEQFVPPGDFSFTSLDAEYASYFKVSEDVLGRVTTVQLNTAARYILQPSEDVPFYERYYLGGNNFRGFDFRGVSPKGIRNDTGGPSNDPVGGTFSFFAGAELRQPIYEDILSGVVFLDTGTVDDSISFSRYRVSTGVGLRIMVPQISPAPFAFDFGFPLLKQKTDDTRLFTFSVDLPFR